MSIGLVDLSLMSLNKACSSMEKETMKNETEPLEQMKKIRLEEGRLKYYVKSGTMFQLLEYMGVTCVHVGRFWKLFAPKEV